MKKIWSNIKKIFIWVVSLVGAIFGAILMIILFLSSRKKDNITKKQEKIDEGEAFLDDNDADASYNNWKRKRKKI